MEKGQEAGFLRLRSSKITLTKEKKKRGKEKKAMVELLVFIMATFEMVFGRKKRLFDGGDQFVNSARYEIF